jgi:precorrin-6B methylase 2
VGRRFSRAFVVVTLAVTGVSRPFDSPAAAQGLAQSRPFDSPAAAQGLAQGRPFDSPTAAQGLAQGRQPDIHFVATPQPVADAMLTLARVTPGDVVYDLGSGDGRIPITAAKKYGARGIGIDIDPQRIREANANAQASGVTDKVKFLNQDLFTTDISEASVVTLYLLPSLNLKLMPKLMKELKPGTRIVSQTFTMGERYPPEKTVQAGYTSVYLWTVPMKEKK